MMNNYTSIQQGDHESSNNNDADQAGDSSQSRPTTGAASMMSHKHKTLLGGFVTVVAGLAVMTSGTGNDTLVTLDAVASVVVVATAAAAAVRDCKDVQCGEDTWCESPQLCGEDKPYQCMNGSARFGCSHQRLRWTLKSSDTTCSECCDVTTCEGCRMSKWFLSYLVSNGSSDAVCVERYYEEEADMLANAKYLDKVNSTTFAVQQETMCQDRRHVAYSRFLEQYVPFKGGETTYGICWTKHFAKDE